MLQRLLIIISFSFCGALISYAYASVYTTANELFLKSGIKTQIEAIPKAVLLGFQASVNQAAHLRKLTPSEKDYYQQLINEAYNSAELQKVVTDYMVAQLNEVEMNAALGWLNTPLGQKITSLENAVVGKEASLEMVRYVQSLEKNPPPKAFFNHVDRLAKELNATDIAVEMAMNSQMAITLAMATVEPKTTEEQLEYIQKELNQARSLIQAIVKQEIMTNLMFTYRSVSTDELEQYIQFTASEKGKKYQLAMAQALSKAVTHGSRILSAKMIKIIQARAKNNG